jgi:hypothetical protein
VWGVDIWSLTHLHLHTHTHTHTHTQDWLLTFIDHNGDRHFITLAPEAALFHSLTYTHPHTHTHTHTHTQDWLLTFIDHNGDRHFITLEPGDALYYESASCLHGRPTPFKGNFFANTFVHFKVEE